MDSLEQTRTLVLDGTADGGQMTARFADLCEELARAVTGLLALQDRLATTDTDSLQRLDGLVQTASTLLRLQQQNTADSKRSLAAGAVVSSAAAASRKRLHNARSRRADSSSPSTGMGETNQNVKSFNSFLALPNLFLYGVTPGISITVIRFAVKY